MVSRRRRRRSGWQHTFYMGHAFAVPLAERSTEHCQVRPKKLRSSVIPAHGLHVPLHTNGVQMDEAVKGSKYISMVTNQRFSQSTYAYLVGNEVIGVA